jgi:hypothetical protein
MNGVPVQACQNHVGSARLGSERFVVERASLAI